MTTVLTTFLKHIGFAFELRVHLYRILATPTDLSSIGTERMKHSTAGGWLGGR